MKSTRVVLWLGLLLGVAALAFSPWLSTAAEKDKDKGKDKPKTELKLQRDDTALDRSAASPQTSYAPMLKKVSPAVVNVFSAKTVKAPRWRQQIPGMRDPFLRRFFGEPGPDEGEDAPPMGKQQGLGSGVIVTADGYILTNNHVVEGADEIKVALPNGEKKEYTAKLVGTDPKTDIAVLKIEATNLPALTLGNSDQLEVGDVVFAVGNPFGVGQTVTMGIVSAVGRTRMGITDYEDFIQTDASINPGNSGGALVDAKGRLVGVNSAILSQSGGNLGIGFAVPISMASKVLESLVQYGKVSRGFLGIAIQDVSPQLAKAFGLPDTSGALVGEVTPDSAAAKADVRQGDVVLVLNGEKVKDASHLRLSVAQLQPGSKITLKILRDGKEKEVTATLGELTDRVAAGGPAAGGEKSPLRGVTLEDIDPRSRRELNLPTELKGALVTAVEPDSPAAAGLFRGDVITEINRKSVDSAPRAFELLKQAKDGPLLLHVWRQGRGLFVALNN